MTVINKTFLLKLGQIIVFQLVPFDSGPILPSNVEWLLILCSSFQVLADVSNTLGVLPKKEMLTYPSGRAPGYP